MKYCVYDKDGKQEGEYESRREATRKAAAIGGSWKKIGSHVIVSKDLQENPAIEAALEYGVESQEDKLWHALPKEARKKIKHLDPVRVVKHTPHVDRRMGVGKGLTRLAARGLDKVVGEEAINELSNKILVRYLRKAIPDRLARAKARDAGINHKSWPLLNRKVLKRVTGINRALDRIGAVSDPKTRIRIQNRYNNNLKKEENLHEPINEISTKVLNSYVFHASKEARSLATARSALVKAGGVSKPEYYVTNYNVKPKYLTKKLQNREAGIDRAVNKIGSRYRYAKAAMKDESFDALQETSKAKLFRYVFSGTKSLKKLGKRGGELNRRHEAGYSVPEQEASETFRKLKNRIVGITIAKSRLSGVPTGKVFPTKLKDRKQLGLANNIGKDMNDAVRNKKKLDETSKFRAASYIVKKSGGFLKHIAGVNRKKLFNDPGVVRAGLTIERPHGFVPRRNAASNAIKLRSDHIARVDRVLKSKQTIPDKTEAIISSAHRMTDSVKQAAYKKKT